MRDRLITQLWCPTAMDAAPTLCPRRRRNKRMKVLTLTDWNFHEITAFERNDLTKRDLVVAWTQSHQNVWRLETELGKSTVMGSARYEDAIINDTQSISCHFPFDVVNLDFSSQNPLQTDGRIEREIKSVEYSIKIQNGTGSNGLVIIYTTKIYSNSLDSSSVKQASDAIVIQGWPGLSINGFSSQITDYNEKIRFIKGVIEKICNKYNYCGSFSELSLVSSGGSERIYSIAGLIRKM